MAKASLAELIGKRAAEKVGGSLTLADLPDLLGERMPELPLNAIGKHRLVSALRARFGVEFRNIPGMKDLIRDFDETVEFENKVEQMRAIRVPKAKKKEN